MRKFVRNVYLCSVVGQISVSFVPNGISVLLICKRRLLYDEHESFDGLRYDAVAIAKPGSVLQPKERRSEVLLPDDEQ